MKVYIPTLTLDLFVANGELAKFRNFYILAQILDGPSEESHLIRYSFFFFFFLKIFFMQPNLANRKT